MSFCAGYERCGECHRCTGRPLSIEEAVAELDALKIDPEECHGRADDILVAMVPPEVAAAYRRLQARMPWWATA